MNYLVYGVESYLIDNNIKKIIEDNKIDENSVYKIDMTNSSIEDLVSHLDTYDMFSNMKVVIAENCIFLSSQKTNNEYNLDLLIKYINNTNLLSILVLRLDDNIDERKKINKDVKNLCKVIKCDKLDEIGLFNYIKMRFQDVNYRIDNSSIYELINRSNSNLYTVNNEINKLIMYKDDKIININDVNNLVSKKIHDDVFLFVNSVIKKDKIKMFEIYNDLVNYHNEEIIKLINLIYNQFRLMYQVSVLKNDKLSETEISKKLGVHPYRVKMCLKDLNIDEKTLLKYIYKLCNLDLNIKSGKVNKTSAFELFLLSI